MDNVKIASELIKIAKELIAIEFPTQEAMDKYLKDHPSADKSNHRVIKAPASTSVKTPPSIKNPPVEIGKKEKKFNEQTDEWFDDATNHGNKDVVLNEVKDFVGKTPSATKNNMEKVVGLLKKSKQPWAAKAVKHAEGISNGSFGGEFRNVEGPHSQISEFLSMLKQSLHYNG